MSIYAVGLLFSILFFVLWLASRVDKLEQQNKELTVHVESLSERISLLDWELQG